MRPDQALFFIENTGGVGVPEIYRKMPWPMLVALVQECAKSPSGYSDGTELPPSASGRERPVEPVPFTGVVIRHGRRLSTLARRRAAFLYYLARCRTVQEAAARAGVDRRTAQRWRDRYPAFDRRWSEILEARRREVLDDIIMTANVEEMRPIYYRGRQIGIRQQRDRGLRLYLLKQHDAALARADAARARGVSKTPHSLRQTPPANGEGFPSDSNDLTAEKCGSRIAP